MLEDQELSFGRLQEDLVGIERFDGSNDRLASGDQAYHYLLALKLGDELRRCRLRDGLFFFRHFHTCILASLPLINLPLLQAIEGKSSLY